MANDKDKSKVSSFSTKTLIENQVECKKKMLVIDQGMSMQEFLLCAKNIGADPEVLKQGTGVTCAADIHFLKACKGNKTVIGCEKIKSKGRGWAD